MEEPQACSPQGDALPTHVSEVHRLGVENFELKRKLISGELAALGREYLAFMAELGRAYQFDGNSEDAVDYSTGQIIRRDR